jgi:predicted ATPase/class 3 adenylate cyclase
MTSDLPVGTVTFLFTDIEGSTRLLEALEADYGQVLETHRRLLREAFDANDGHEVDTQGDAFFVAFPTARDAIRAAAHAQRALVAHAWPRELPVRVRMGVHTGRPMLHAGLYFGMDVHRGARVAAAGHGGQVLVSEATRDSLAGELDDGLALRDLGAHRLKDLTQPQHLFQLEIRGLENEFPALKTLENRPTNLPTQPTALIGREQELGQAADLLRRDDVRMLTFTGPGGTGKTRLALQLAAELLEEFSDGVFFINLAAITDPALVVSTIAQTLAVRESRGLTLEETLVEYLRDRRMLLVVDNFEQLLAGAASLVPLLTAPGPKLLVTSRAPLRLSAEHEYAVPPLELPDPAHLPGLAALSQNEAVALFVERARAVRADFEVTNENAPAVAEICVRLDGLPLAVELAAARVRALSPQALLRRLEQRLTLLTGGRLDVPARQQTLRAAIEWSYALLSEPQQRLLSRLAAFVGGCDLESAEAVCDDCTLGLDVLEGVASLIENSLVRKQDDPDGEPRYFMLETIREYATEKLEASGERDEVRRRHAEHFLALCDRADRLMVGLDVPQTGSPEERVQRELPNLRAAFEWAFDQRNRRLVLGFAAAMWGWTLSANNTEARAWVTRALRETEGVNSTDRARALVWLGVIETSQADFRSAEASFEKARSIFAEKGDEGGVTRALIGAGSAAASLGEAERARVLLNEALARADAYKIGFDRANARVAAAMAASSAGDADDAQELLEEGLAFYRELGAPRRIWFAQLINAGWFALQKHDFVRAKAVLEEYLGGETWKSPVGIANAHANLGLVALYERDRDAADFHFREALPLAWRAGAKRSIAEELYGLAAVAAIDRDAERCARLWGAADAIKLSTNSPLSEPEKFLVEEFLEPARAALGEDVGARMATEGAALGLDEALDYALAPDNG